MRSRTIAPLALAALLFCGSAVSAATVDIASSKDNTLYEDAGGALSNGAGENIFAGNTAVGDKRRAAIAFDVAGSVPAGATIQSVSLKLDMTMTIAGPVDVSLHRATSDWGEGTSDAPGQEGAGAPATNGDATWLHTFFPGSLWVSAGGGFMAAASAAESVGGNGSYDWGSTPEMVADAQGWLDNPGGNFGWILVGDESAPVTAKRFVSREGPTDLQPLLTVTFEAGNGHPVPAASTLALAIVALLLLAGVSLVVRQRRGAAPVS